VTDTNAFVKKVGAALKLDTTAIIRQEEDRVYEYIHKVADFIVDFDVQLHFATISDAGYAVALNRFLVLDLGWLPSVAVVTDQVPEQHKAAIHDALSLGKEISPHVLYEADSWKIWEAVEKERPAFILGSSLDREAADRIGAWRLSVSFPVTDRVVLDRGYAGYRGTTTLIEDILSVIVAPF